MREIKSSEQRNMNIEVLRVVAMLQIVMLHFLSHGGVNEVLNQGNPIYFICSFIRSWAYLGVNCFVLISGYFLSTSSFKLSRLVKLYAQLVVFSVIALMIGKFSFGLQISKEAFVGALLPVGRSTYWFASVYFILVVVAPVLNLLIQNIDKQQFKFCILILIILFSFIPSIEFWSKTVFSGGKDIAWFVTLYMVAAYIRKYSIHFEKSKWLMGLLIGLLGTVLGEFGAKKVFRLANINIGKLFFYNNAPLILLSSVSLFILFVSASEKNSSICRIIGKMGQFTFGVYLLHDNEFIRESLWKQINATKYIDSAWKTICYMIVVSIAIFIAGCLVEYFRKMIQKLLKVNTLYQKIDMAITKKL